MNIEVFDVRTAFVATADVQKAPLPYYRIVHKGYQWVRHIAWNTVSSSSYDLDEVVEVALVLKEASESNSGCNKVLVARNSGLWLTPILLI